MRSPTASSEHVVLTLWTADPRLAQEADGAGVDRVGVDLERLGKAERQRDRDTWISPHAVHDLEGLVLAHARRFARLNAMHPGTPDEVDAALAHGAQVLMLPMTMDAAQAAAFVRAVGGRATVVLLVEHHEALRRAGSIASVEGVDEVHVGLNDLALSLGLRNRWLSLADERVVDAGAAVRAAGRRFGLGGIGRADDVHLPVPAPLVYAQYARTGARAAVLARSFRDAGSDLVTDVAKARAALADWFGRAPAEIARAHEELVRRARASDGW